jgi:PadR family transcriptional regulator PadR
LRDGARRRLISPATAKVLAAFLDDPKAEQYGFGLMRSTSLKSGSLYPILDRLVQRGWLEVYNEDIDEAAEGRRRRRLYRITPRGEREAPVAFDEFREGMAAVLRWAPSPAV